MVSVTSSYGQYVNHYGKLPATRFLGPYAFLSMPAGANCQIIPRGRGGTIKRRQT
jgi:hypothetical protein